MPNETSAAEEDMTFHKAALMPWEWAVICPMCGAGVPVESVRQDDNAAWHADGVHQFPECDECHAKIEVTPVSVQDVNHDA